MFAGQPCRDSFYFEQGIAAEPTSLFGDVYGYDFVFLFIKSIDGLESRDNGDFVLGGATSEKTPTVVFIIFCDKLYIWFVIIIEIYLNVSGRSFS